jgi:hypothetical protein
MLGFSVMASGNLQRQDSILNPCCSLVRKLRALRGPGESYSDVILRLAVVGRDSLSRS